MIPLCMSVVNPVGAHLNDCYHVTQHNTAHIYLLFKCQMSDGSGSLIKRVNVSLPNLSRGSSMCFHTDMGSVDQEMYALGDFLFSRAVSSDTSQYV